MFVVPHNRRSAVGTGLIITRNCGHRTAVRQVPTEVGQRDLGGAVAEIVIVYAGVGVVVGAEGRVGPARAVASVAVVEGCRAVDAATPRQHGVPLAHRLAVHRLSRHAHRRRQTHYACGRRHRGRHRGSGRDLIPG